MDPRTMAIKQNRRMLLDALKMVYSMAPLSFEAICAVMPLVEKFNVQQDVEYLLAKGLVECVNARPNMAWRDRMFRLTYKGVEIADRINTDPALEP